MINTPSSPLKHLLVAIVASWVVALSACARGPQWHVGLDAIASDGHWGTAIEHSGDPLTWQLVLFDLLEEQPPIVLAQNVDARTVSSFSPDSRYVLFRTPDGWSLVDTTTSQQVEVAAGDERVQFLPDGELLVISPTDDGLTQFVVIADLTDLQQRSSIIDRIRFSFQNQLSDAGVELLGGVVSPVCESRSVSGYDLWTIVKADGTVSVFVTTPDGISMKDLVPKLAAGVTTLLNRQAAGIQRVLTPKRSELREQIKQKATDAGEALGEEELERQVENEFQQLVSDVFGSSLFGSLSPDGTKLFFLRVEAGEGDKWLYSLYLIDLATGAEPRVLSSETEWVPSFSFSPNSRQMLFESNRDGGRSLYLANSNGTNIQRLPVQRAFNPCWY